MSTTLTASRIRPFQLWLLFSLPYLLLFYYMNTFVATDTVYYNSFSERLSIDRIKEIISRQKDYLWISYLFIPIMLYIKVLLTSGCLYMRLFLSQSELSFKEIMKLVFACETVFVVNGIIRIIVLSFIFKPGTLKELQAFAPLSLLSVLNIEKIPLYLFYPLQVLNLFELGYWIFLSMGLANMFRISVGKAFSYVLSSYIVALVVWVLIVMFIQLQFLA